MIFLLKKKTSKETSELIRESDIIAAHRKKTSKAMFRGSPVIKAEWLCGKLLSILALWTRAGWGPCWAVARPEKARRQLGCKPRSHQHREKPSWPEPKRT